MKKFLSMLVIFCIAFLCVGVVEAADNTKIRVGVFKFRSGVANVTTDQATVVGDIFTRMLANSERITIVSSAQLEEIANEHKIGISSGYIPPEVAAQVGKFAHCNYIVVGTVTNLNSKASSTGIWFLGLQRDKSSAAADIDLIDVKSGKKLASISEQGGTSHNGGFLNLYGLSLGKHSATGLEAGSVAELLAKITMKVRNAIGDPILVKEASEKQITINLGTMGGAEKGVLYRIYTGSGENEQTFAVVKVSEAKIDTCVAEIASKSSGNLSLVRVGDKVDLTNSDELKELVKHKSFTTTREK